MYEVKELQEKQKAVEKVMAKNEAALERIDRELEILTKKNKVSEGKTYPSMNLNSTGFQGPTENATEAEKEVIGSDVKTKRCRYYNKGYCKY